MSLDPPRPRGPHLNAMRCFETAARLGGFAAAAEELSVTAGAVSQQVKALEDWIGASLFERRSQGVALTALGAQVADEFTGAFDALGGALHALRANAPQVPINIAALPAIAQLWLAPRLPKLRAQMPERSISITALETAPNLKREVFDISIFYGVPKDDPRQRVLATDVIFPVCAPQVAERLTTPADLNQFPVLVDTVWSSDWPLWWHSSGCPDPVPHIGSQFSLYSLALQEARNGAGVILGHADLVEADLLSGALVAPFDQRVATGVSLILETPAPVEKGGRLDAVIRALCD